MPSLEVHMIGEIEYGYGFLLWSDMAFIYLLILVWYNCCSIKDFKYTTEIVLPLQYLSGISQALMPLSYKYHPQQKNKICIFRIIDQHSIFKSSSIWRGLLCRLPWACEHKDLSTTFYIQGSTIIRAWLSRASSLII